MDLPRRLLAITLLSGLILAAGTAVFARQSSFAEGRGGILIEMDLGVFARSDFGIQADGYFLFVYQFEIDEDAHPAHIQPLASQKWALKDTVATEAGLSKWTFAGLEPGKEYFLTLHWEHGRNIFLSLLSDQMSLEVRWPSSLTSSGDRIKLEIPLLGYGIRSGTPQATDSFSLHGHFFVTDDPHLEFVGLTAGGEFVDLKAVVGRLAHWTLEGLSPSRYVMILNWERSKGYTLLSLQSEQMALSIRLQK